MGHYARTPQSGLEVLTEVVDQVTIGLSARWLGRGATSVAAVDRVGRTVVARRAVAARAGDEAGGGPAAGAGPAGVVRDPVRAPYGHPVGVPAAGAGLRLGHDLLAAPGGLERGRYVGEAAPGAAEEAAVGEAAGLVAGGDRFLPRAGGPAGPKAVAARSTVHGRAASTTSSPTAGASRSRCR